jgi:hypothetical protein
MRAELPSLDNEVVQEIQRRVPEFGRPLDPAYGRGIRTGVEQALHEFVDRVADPRNPHAFRPQVADVFRALGRGEVVEGRSLDALQAACRLGGRIAWRRWVTVGRQADVPPPAMYRLAEAVFAHVDELTAAALEGYQDAQSRTDGEAERRRRRLLELILTDPPVAPRAIADLAHLARWPLPATVAVVVLDERAAERRLPPSLPSNHVLSGEDHVGLELARRGLVEDEGVIQCDRHLPALVLLQDDDLIRTMCEQRLAPLAHLSGKQQARVAETLLAWLECRGNAPEVAKRIHLHPQTVRYRIRQIEKLLGSEMYDPNLRFGLEMALRARRLLSTGPAQVRPAKRPRGIAPPAAAVAPARRPGTAGRATPATG